LPFGTVVDVRAQGLFRESCEHIADVANETPLLFHCLLEVVFLAGCELVSAAYEQKYKKLSKYQQPHLLALTKKNKQESLKAPSSAGPTENPVFFVCS
jgi:hypothetical protein